MPDELRPCPWCGHDEPTVDYVSVEEVSQSWGVTCPNCERTVEGAQGEKDDAIAAWNAIPRAPKWTEYDGTESTLPIDEKLCCVELTGKLLPRRTLAWRYMYDSSGISVLDPCWQEDGVGLSRIIVGDRWLPWPGDAQ